MGGGAVYNGQSAQGGWSSLERERHINELEILAVRLGLKSFIFDLKGKQVCIKSDNTTTYVISMQWEALNLLIATPSQNSLW